MVQERKAAFLKGKEELRKTLQHVKTQGNAQKRQRNSRGGEQTFIVINSDLDENNDPHSLVDQQKAAQVAPTAVGNQAQEPIRGSSETRPETHSAQVAAAQQDPKPDQVG